MRKSRRLTILTGILIAVIGMAASGGVAEEQNRDRTGSPDGSNTCAQCHNSGSFNLIVNFTIKDVDGQEVTTYIPGETYDLRFSMLTLAGPSASAYGFQTTALLEDLSNAGEFNTPGASVQLEEVTNATLSGRHIAEHAQPSGSGVFNVKWTAPEADEGDVTFYYAATAVNSNQDNSGDNGMNSQVVLSPAMPDNVNEEFFDDVYFSFVNDALNVRLTDGALPDFFSVYDVQGRALHRQSIADSEWTIALSSRPQIVLVVFEENGQVFSKMIAQ